MVRCTRLQQNNTKKMDAKLKHNIVEDGVDIHKGDYWYKCTKCGQSDWIAFYETKEQLDFYNKPCVPKENKNRSKLNI